MRREFAGVTEIAGARDEGLAEESAPDAIHNDARGERIFGGSDRFGEFLASAAGFEWLGIVLGKDAEEATLGNLAGAFWIAANENVEVGDGAVLNHMERVAIHFVGIRVL